MTKVCTAGPPSPAGRAECRRLPTPDKRLVACLTPQETRDLPSLKLDNGPELVLLAVIGLARFEPLLNATDESASGLVGQHPVLKLDRSSLAYKAHNGAVDNALTELLDQVEAEARLTRSVGVDEPGKWFEARKHDGTPYSRIEDPIPVVEERIEGITCTTVLAGLEVDLAGQELPYAFPVDSTGSALDRQELFSNVVHTVAFDRCKLARNLEYLTFHLGDRLEGGRVFALPISREVVKQPVLIPQLAFDEGAGQLQPALLVVGEELLATGDHGSGQVRRSQLSVRFPRERQEIDLDAVLHTFLDDVGGDGDSWARDYDRLDLVERDLLDDVLALLNHEPLALFPNEGTELGDDDLPQVGCHGVLHPLERLHSEARIAADILFILPTSHVEGASWPDRTPAAQGPRKLHRRRRMPKTIRNHGFPPAAGCTAQSQRAR